MFEIPGMSVGLKMEISRKIPWIYFLVTEILSKEVKRLDLLKLRLSRSAGISNCEFSSQISFDC